MASSKEGGLVRSRQQVPHRTLTEMRDNYCQPQLKDELQDNRFVTAYGCNASRRVHRRGIGTIHLGIGYTCRHPQCLQVDCRHRGSNPEPSEHIIDHIHFFSPFSPFISVPTVVQRHIRDRRDVSELTTYDTFFGRKASVVPYVLKSLQPQELQQLCKALPEKGQWWFNA